MQAVDVPIIDNRQCERWHKSNGINVIIYDEMMCAGYREGSKDSCQVSTARPPVRARSTFDRVVKPHAVFSASNHPSHESFS